MDRVRLVEICDQFHHDLEQIEKNKFKLKEIEGKIISCESGRRGLIIRLENRLTPEKTSNKKIIWPYGKEGTPPAICGQGLRCFYEETYQRGDVEEIEMGAYELMDKENSSHVIRRGIKLKYKFVEYK